MAKNSLLQKITHWLVEFIAALIVAGIGAILLLVVPAEKQGQIATSVFTGPPAWAVVLIGALGIVNSVRRGILRKPRQ